MQQAVLTSSLMYTITLRCICNGILIMHFLSSIQKKLMQQILIYMWFVWLCGSIDINNAHILPGNIQYLHITGTSCIAGSRSNFPSPLVYWSSTSPLSLCSTCSLRYSSLVVHHDSIF